MHRHGRGAVLKGVVLHERNFGERLYALRLILNSTFDQCYWDALRRALRKIGHERFRPLALRHGLGDG
jgi:hypothetical protein